MPIPISNNWHKALNGKRHSINLIKYLLRAIRTKRTQSEQSTLIALMRFVSFSYGNAYDRELGIRTKYQHKYHTNEIRIYNTRASITRFIICMRKSAIRSHCSL